MTMARAAPPAPSTAATTSSSFSRRRPATTTSKPSVARRRAMAAPMPVPPPVMSARGRVWSSRLLRHAAEDRRSPLDVSRGPGTAQIHPTGGRAGSGGSARRRVAVSRSARVVTLRARGSPSTTSTRSPRRSTRPASSVASLDDGVRPLEDVAPEALGRLHRPQGRAVGGPDDDAVLVDLLDGVDDQACRARLRRLRLRRRPRPGRRRPTGVRHRAASWTSTISTSSPSTARPAATESPRSAPPTTIVTGVADPSSRHTPSATSSASPRCASWSDDDHLGHRGA